MTERNSQYERFLNQDMVDRKLTRLAGQITNLRKGNVETVELISGENLLPPVNPVERYLETKKLNELQELNIPIQQAIEKMQSEVSGLQPSIRQAIEDVNRNPPQNEVMNEVTNDPPQNNQPAIELPQNDTPKVGFAFLTEENKKILEEQGLHPDIVINQKKFNRWHETDIRKTVSLNTNYGHEKNKKITTVEREEELNKLIELNRKYREALKDLKKYMIGDGIATHSRKTSRFTAASGRSPRSTLSTACPVLDQMIERARVLIGEINAGNTSVNLRNELSRILLTLYKNKRISKEEYRRFATM